MGVAEAVLNFFTNFAKSGDPNGQGNTHRDIPDYGTYREKTRYHRLIWEPYEVGNQSYLSISKYYVEKFYFGLKLITSYAIVFMTKIYKSWNLCTIHLFYLEALKYNYLIVKGLR